jgi:chromosomal replication initiator protein
MTNEQLWQATLGELELCISKANFITWFKNTSIASKQDGQIVISVPNGFTKEWLKNKYHKEILKAIQNICPEVTTIEYKIGQQSSGAATSLKESTETPQEKDNDILPRPKTRTAFLILPIISTISWSDPIMSWLMRPAWRSAKNRDKAIIRFLSMEA